MMVANTLTRRFVWTTNSLWREEVERRFEEEGWKTTVCVAGADIITDVEHLGRYLTRMKGEKPWAETYGDEIEEERSGWKSRQWTGKEPVEVLWFEHCNHAEEFENKYGRDDRSRILEACMRYSQEGAEIVKRQSQNGLVDDSAGTRNDYGSFAGEGSSE